MDELESLIQQAVKEQSIDMTVTQDFNVIRNEIIEREFRREIRRSIRSLEQDYFPYK